MGLSLGTHLGRRGQVQPLPIRPNRSLIYLTTVAINTLQVHLLLLFVMHAEMTTRVQRNTAIQALVASRPTTRCLLRNQQQQLPIYIAMVANCTGSPC